MRSGSRDLSLSSGYTLVAVLVLLFVVSLGLAAVGPSYSHQVQRDREQQLLRIGVVYAEALQSYYDNSPGNLKQFPMQLEQLTLDQRYVGVRRHLRQLYPDPMQPERPWGLVFNVDGRVIGVHSTSNAPPLSATGGPATAFTARSYSDWKFIAKDGNP